MKKILATVLFCTLFSFSLVSCGGKNNKVSAISDEEQNKEVTEGEKGNPIEKLDVCIGPSPETMDPQLNSTLDGGTMIMHCFEGLVKYGENGQVLPAMAESWESSKDGLTWTFHLRENLKWSDGMDLSSEDFVYSFKRLSDPETAAPYGYDMLSMVEGFEEANKGNLDSLKVEAPDERTFVVHLSAPLSYFDKVVAFSSLVPLRKDILDASGEAWSLEPSTYISNGAYQMEEYVDGDYISLKKNPYYYDADKVTVKELVFHLVEDDNSAYSAYMEGSLDISGRIPSEEMASLRESEDFKSYPLLGTAGMIFNMEKPPFDDVKVRKAFALAIDKKYIAENIFEGYRTPASTFVCEGVSDPEDGSSFVERTLKDYGTPFHTEEYEKDLEEAKKLMKDAGFPNGVGFPKVKYLNNAGGANNTIAEYLQSAFKELGVEMEIDTQEWKVVSATQHTGDFQLTRFAWVYDYDEPLQLLNLFRSQDSNNYAHYSNKKYDKLMLTAMKETDGKKRSKALHKAEQMLLEDLPMVPMVFSKENYLIRPSIQGMQHLSSGHSYFMYCTEAE